jgi:small subunit ribosomal protein S3
MGQKCNPNGLRLGIVKDWDSIWYAGKEYAAYLLEDFHIRQYLKSELYRAGVSDIKIFRKKGTVEISVYVARPGVIFGKGGQDTNFYCEELEKKINKKVIIHVMEDQEGEKRARLIAEWMIGQLERRVPFRRVMKMAVQRAQKAGAKGIKVSTAGRLGGTEIARTEWYREGKVPLHTLRADIDYAFSEALTTYGKIGVKVWIYNGEVITKEEEIEPELLTDEELEVVEETT